MQKNKSSSLKCVCCVCFLFEFFFFFTVVMATRILCVVYCCLFPVCARPWTWTACPTMHQLETVQWSPTRDIALWAETDVPQGMARACMILYFWRRKVINLLISDDVVTSGFSTFLVSVETSAFTHSSWFCCCPQNLLLVIVSSFSLRLAALHISTAHVERTP